VGDFEISASVKPTKAAVGDPMTLTLSIHSLSENAEELRTLQPPPLDSAALTQRFRMPADPLAGSVAGSTKVFTQTIRPLSAEVKEIPPIEFSYFNPATARYATVKTQPIPIQVSPAERINSAAIEGLASGKKDAPKTTLTAVDGGLFANALPGPDLLTAARPARGAPRVTPAAASTPPATPRPSREPSRATSRRAPAAPKGPSPAPTPWRSHARRARTTRRRDGSTRSWLWGSARRSRHSATAILASRASGRRNCSPRWIDSRGVAARSSSSRRSSHDPPRLRRDRRNRAAVRIGRRGR
jgi:hypothetical protein